MTKYTLLLYCGVSITKFKVPLSLHSILLMGGSETWTDSVELAARGGLTAYL